MSKIDKKLRGVWRHKYGDMCVLSGEGTTNYVIGIYYTVGDQYFVDTSKHRIGLLPSQFNGRDWWKFMELEDNAPIEATEMQKILLDGLRIDHY